MSQLNFLVIFDDLPELNFIILSLFIQESINIKFQAFEQNNNHKKQKHRHNMPNRPPTPSWLLA